jgi:UDP-glucose 4-epimerase
MATVIVTGSAGYIGGQTALQLRDLGHAVYGIDRRKSPQHLAEVCNGFLHQDFASDMALSWIIGKQPDAIIHCAGTSLVGPSMTDPGEYYNNNVAKTLKLLDVVKRALPRTRIIFSSSAATYGEPTMIPISETEPTDPVSPYGESKLMIDMMLNSYHRAYATNFVSFRYFNACGADPQGRHGQEPGATHIIGRVLESIRDSQEFTLYGNDYDTRDGTCVRDYVHVADIAQAHILALSPSIPAGIYNLGSNQGTSNREIIAAAERITGQTVKIKQGPRRQGDPDALVADSSKFNQLVRWQRFNLDDMIQHAWNWYVR